MTGHSPALPAAPAPARFGPPPAAPGPAPAPPVEDLAAQLGQLGALLDAALLREDLTVADAAKLRRRQTKLRELLAQAAMTTPTAEEPLLVMGLGQLARHAPSDRQLARPGRVPVLRAAARKRLARSPMHFVDPDTAVAALVVTLGEGREAEADELVHRLLHYLAEVNLAERGVGAALLLQQLARVGKTAALRPAERSEVQGEIVQEARGQLLRFLGQARGR